MPHPLTHGIDTYFGEFFANRRRVATVLLVVSATLAVVVATDSSGVARYARTEPGPLPVEISANGVRFRALLLDSERGRVLQVPR